MLKVGLPRTAGTTPKTEGNLTGSNRTMLLLTTQWMEYSFKENNKISDKDKSHINIESEIYDNDLYQIENMSLDDKKENIECRKRAFESELGNTYEIEIQNVMTCINGNKVN